MRLSPTERMILDLLREDSRRSFTEIAAIVGLSRPTVKYYVSKLLEKKIIRRFTIDIDSTEIAPTMPVSAMFDVQLKRNACSAVYASIKHWNGLVSVWSISGAVDMRVLAQAANQIAIEDMRNRLARHPDVVSITTSIILNTWCERINAG